MKKETNTFKFEYYSTTDLDSFSELEKELIHLTIEKASHAYAPYSKFNVSAGVLMSDNKILYGTNVENASYPIGICAERNVLSHVISNYPDGTISTIAVYAEKEIKKLKSPITPCGMCRQALLEAENRQHSPIKLIMIGHNNQYLIVDKCLDLLPFAFDGKML